MGSRISARRPLLDRFSSSMIIWAKWSILLSVSGPLLSLILRFMAPTSGLIGFNKTKLSETFDRACAKPYEQPENFVSGEVYTKTEQNENGITETEEVYCDKGTSSVFMYPGIDFKSTGTNCTSIGRLEAKPWDLSRDFQLSVKLVIISESQHEFSPSF